MIKLTVAQYEQLIKKKIIAAPKKQPKEIIIRIPAVAYEYEYIMIPKEPTVHRG